MQITAFSPGKSTDLTNIPKIKEYQVNILKKVQPKYRACSSFIEQSGPLEIG